MPTTAAAKACSLITFGLIVVAVLDGAVEERNLDAVEL